MDDTGGRSSTFTGPPNAGVALLACRVNSRTKGFHYSHFFGQITGSPGGRLLPSSPFARLPQILRLRIFSDVIRGEELYYEEFHDLINIFQRFHLNDLVRCYTTNQEKRELWESMLQEVCNIMDMPIAERLKKFSILFVNPHLSGVAIGAVMRATTVLYRISPYSLANEIHDLQASVRPIRNIRLELDVNKTLHAKRIFGAASFLLRGANLEAAYLDVKCAKGDTYSLYLVGVVAQLALQMLLYPGMKRIACEISDGTGDHLRWEFIGIRQGWDADLHAKRTTASNLFVANALELLIRGMQQCNRVVRIRCGVSDGNPHSQWKILRNGHRWLPVHD